MTFIYENFLWCWFIFCTLFFVSFDFYLSSRQENKTLTFKDSLKWSISWVGIALFFIMSSWMFLKLTNNPDADSKLFMWLTGYVVEKSLAVDNIFVFLIIFTMLAIPDNMQKKLLMIGVNLAIILRLLIIFLAAALISSFQWLLTVFGIFLVIMAYKTWPSKKDKDDNFPIIDLIKKYIPVKKEQGYLKKDLNGKYYITLSLLALITIAVVDIVFAVDSIPAIFAITTDTWIVASSNVFAVLGLRPLYFLLKNLKDKLTYLPYGLSIILCFIGIKLLVMPWFHIPIAFSLGFILLVLTFVCLFSFKRIKK